MATKRLFNLGFRTQVISKATFNFPTRFLLTPSSPPPEENIQELKRKFTHDQKGVKIAYDPKGHKNSGEGLFGVLPSNQSELQQRQMLDSYGSVVIPLGSNVALRDRYLSQLGWVRTGRLLEDMDVFAVYLVHKHILYPKQEIGQPCPVAIVTALVDKIDIKRKFIGNIDIKMSGHVTWVGTSSVESTMQLHQKIDDQWEKIIEAVFVMVARDDKGNACYINPLKINTPEEQAIYQKGVSNQNRRQKRRDYSLFSDPPTEEEQVMIHDFFISTVDYKATSFRRRGLPENSVWMEDACMKSLIICQPDNRNIYGKIFGGFIMHQAYDLAWANAFVYAQARPLVVCMGDILFKAPVEIGSLLCLTSQICYTSDKYMQGRVAAEILDPITGSMLLTNIFQYTFKLEEKLARQIVPKTYVDAIMWLEGRRQFEHSNMGSIRRFLPNYALTYYEMTH